MLLVSYRLFNNSIQHYFFIISSNNLQIYIFSIHNRLNFSFSDHISSRSLNSLNFVKFSNKSLSLLRIKLYVLIITWYQFNLFFGVNNLFFINWLIINLFGWSFIFSGQNFFSLLNWSKLWLIFINSCLSIFNIDFFLNCFLNRLNSTFFYNLSSWNHNRYISNSCYWIHNRFVCSCLSVNWSNDFLLSNYRSFYDLLLNDWLRNDSLCNHWLCDNSRWNLRLRYYFLRLSNNRFWVKCLRRLNHFRSVLQLSYQLRCRLINNVTILNLVYKLRFNILLLILAGDLWYNDTKYYDQEVKLRFRGFHY